MQKSKLFILAVVGLSLVANTLPGAFSSSTSSLSGTNVDLEYVYTDDGDTVTDVSTEASSNDNNAFEAFDTTDAETQYLYLGSEDAFEEVLFLVERGVEIDEDQDPELTWEYNDGDDWKDLDLDTDEVDTFEDEGTLSIDFDAPSDWDQSEFEDEEAYWIRGTMEGELDAGVLIDQISAVAYNLSVTVTDENGNYLSSLDDDNFRLYDTNDDTLYGWTNEGKGEYTFAINTEDDDTFMLVVDVEDFEEYGIQVTDFDQEIQSYKIQLTPQTGCNSPFLDLDYHWAQTAVELLYCRGIVEGDTTSYGINKGVTRAEFIKMAMMNADINTSKYENKDVPFGDVDEDEWYYEYVAAAYSLDVIDEDDQYYPEGEITRVEALTLLVRLSGMEGDETSTRFSDVKASAWYAATVRLATDYEVVEGYPDNTFQPDRKLSRAEAAVMINNAYNAWYQD